MTQTYNWAPSGHPAEHRFDHRSHAQSRTPHITDRYADLLAPLTNRQRRGMIAKLSQGFYEGWRPSRAEVAALVEQEHRRREYRSRQIR